MKKQQGSFAVVALFFIIFFGAISIFLWLFFFRPLTQNMRVKNWPVTECFIQQAEIVYPSDWKVSFRLNIMYSYQVHAKTYSGSRITPLSLKSKHIEDILPYYEKYRPGTRFPCRYNPQNPGEAYLQPARFSSFIRFENLFSLFIAGIAVIMFYFVWKENKSGKEIQSPNIPLSQKAFARKILSWKRFQHVFLLFILVGSIITGFAFGRSILDTLRVQTWKPGNCVIRKSYTVRSRSDNNTVLHPVIVFSYEYEGKTYIGSRVHPLTASTTSWAYKKVQQYRPGSRVRCYISRRRPPSAILERNIDVRYLFMILPIGFIVLGIAGYIWAKKRENRVKEEMSVDTYGEISPQTRQVLEADDKELPWLKGVQPSELAYKQTNPATRDSRSGAWKNLFQTVIVSLIWNGILSVFIFGGVAKETIARIVLIPFVLVGAFLILLIFYYFMALFNPKIRLTVTPQAVNIGDTLTLRWEVKGKVNRIREMRVELIGTEFAEYMIGNDRQRISRDFMALTLVKMTEKPRMTRGEIHIPLPEQLMHSFSTGNNKVEWMVQIQCDISYWPDVSVKLPIIILPGRKGGHGDVSI